MVSRRSYVCHWWFWNLTRLSQTISIFWNGFQLFHCRILLSVVNFISRKGFSSSAPDSLAYKQLILRRLWKYLSLLGLAFGNKSIAQPDTIPLIELANGTMPYWEPSPYAFIKVNLMVLLDCEYTAAVVLISYCAIIGVASPMQILLMCFFEIIFYRVSFWTWTNWN